MYSLSSAIYRHSDAVASRIGEGIDRLSGLDILITNSGGSPKVNFEEAMLEQFNNVYGMVLRSIVVTIITTLLDLKRSNRTITNLIATSTQQPGGEPRSRQHDTSRNLRPLEVVFPRTRYRRDSCELRLPEEGRLTPAEEERTTHIDRYADEHGLSYEAARKEYIGEIIPLGRGGEVDEFGKAVSFISSDIANYITGHSLNVDGAWSRSLF